MKDQGYCLKKLVCVGILLGKGEIDRKAEILLQNYDRDCSGEIDLEEFSTMIEDMFSVSVYAAVELAKYLDNSLASDLDKYLKKLKKSQTTLKIFVQFIMSMGKENEPIKSDNFLTTFKDSKMKKLASSNGIRELALELYDIQSLE